ncbi:MAG: hypothetical protein RIB03_05670 [Henriciella sp.]|uniref:hypothetical protein n=1 Tax=Henriciella sp. TaxID=1968823 RepID=UPI002612FD01|nr:hypothetical protein [Henriciella sp.]
MFALIKALAATILIAEVAGAFALGLVTVVLFGLHIHGLIFWGIEAITTCFVLYGCAFFFSRALAYERSVSLPKD